MATQGVGSTDRGRVRERNEDGLLVDDHLGLYAVCDGVGGHARGDVASATALAAVAEAVAPHAALLDRIRRGEEAPQGGLGVARAAARHACEEVYRLATSRSDLAGMGTTLTLLLDLGPRIAMAHIGDSRLYLLRRGQLYQLSMDHTLAAELARSGQQVGPQYANVLTRVVGNQVSSQVDTLLFDAFAGDRFLLCSDGVTKMLADEDILEVTSGDPGGVSDELVRRANERGGEDNITAICIAVTPDDVDTGITVGLGGDVGLRLDVLSSIFLFQELSLAQLQRVLNVCDVRDFTPGQCLVSEGETVSAMFVVLRGRVDVTRSGHVLSSLGAGDAVGETTLLAERSARAALVASEATQVLVLDQVRLEGLVRSRPWLGLDVLSRLSQRACAALDRVHDHVSAHELLEAGAPASDLF